MVLVHGVAPGTRHQDAASGKNLGGKNDSEEGGGRWVVTRAR